VIGALGADDPREVGRYRTLAELGRGGMGRVLLGAGPDGRLVAVKLVRAQLVEDDDFRERFRREVTASRKVSGAYTAAVVDADANAATPWLASVFVPGPSLQDTVKATGPLPEESVSRLVAGLAAALVDVRAASASLREVGASATSPRGEVIVTVNAGGGLEQVRPPPAARKLEADVLSALIVATSREAQRLASARMTEVVASYLGDGEALAQITQHMPEGVAR
jgi:hypothetical protein